MKELIYCWHWDFRPASSKMEEYGLLITFLVTVLFLVEFHVPLHK